MATCTTEEVRITDSDIITWLRPYYSQLSKAQDIAYLDCVICLRDTLQIIKHMSEYDGTGSRALLGNQLSEVDTETFDETVLSLKNEEKYLWVEGHKANSKEQDVIIFVEIPKAMIERRKEVAQIIRNSFSKRRYTCTIG